jgi:LacI family transcriptional regulator
VGLGDYPFAERLKPALSTIRIPYDEIGYTAAKVLCERIEHSSTHVIQHLLPVSLIERASSTGESEAVK